MKKIITILTLLTCWIHLHSQPPTKFYTRFGGNGNDVGKSVIQTLDGHYAVAGSTSSFGNGNTDVYLVKVDSMGLPIWAKWYGGYNNDIGTKVIQLSDSGFVIAGYTNSFGSGGYDVYLARTDKGGNLLWQYAYGGMDWEFGYDIKQTPDGGFVICGNTYSYGYGKSDGYIIKTDINGVFQWQKTYGGAEDDNFKAMVLTYNDGFIAFAGTTKSMGDVKGDAWLVKTGLIGDSIFSIKHGVLNKIESSVDLIETVDKGFISCGAIDTSISGNGKTYSYILKHDEFGNFVWQQVYANGLVNDDQFFALCLAKQNNQIALSRKVSNGSFKLESAVMLLNAAGIYNNMSTYGGNDDEETYDIKATRDRGLILTGFTKSFNSQATDVFFLKLDSTLVGVQNIVGVNEIAKKTNDVFIYPSSTESLIYISNLNKEESYYRIYNMSGQLLLNNKISDYKIDVSLLPSSIYILEIKNKTYIKIFKFIKTE